MSVKALVRVHYPPSTWQEKRYIVEASSFLESKYHATRARLQ